MPTWDLFPEGGWELEGAERREQAVEGDETTPCLKALTDVGSIFNLSCDHPHKGAGGGPVAATRPDDFVSKRGLREFTYEAQVNPL